MSPRTILAAGMLAAIAAATSGCVVVDNDPYYDNPVYTTIDADHLLNTDLGYGAGLFVEYTSGGLWRMWTSCDTLLTGTTCDYDVEVLSYSPIEVIEELDTEGWDFVDSVGSSGLRFYAETASHTDGVEFTTSPGALVEIRLGLDGEPAPEYFVWYGNGYIHDGAYGLPVVFQPDKP